MSQKRDACDGWDGSRVLGLTCAHVRCFEGSRHIRHIRHGVSA